MNAPLPPWRRPRLRTATKLFLTGWIVYSLHFATDIVREHYPAFSLAERGTLRVDPYLGLHPDLFAIEGRGAFINNNPGASLLGGLAYAPLRPWVDRVVERTLAARGARGAAGTLDYADPRPLRREFFRKVRERGLDVRFGLAAGAIQALGFAPLAAAMLVVMYRLLLRMRFTPGQARWLALLYGFGTPVFFRAGFLNHNLLVAHATLGTLALLYSPDAPGGIAAKPARLFAAGLVIGAGLLCDYAGAVPVLGFGLYALARLLQAYPLPLAARRMAAMVGGACIPVAALLAYQAWAFGNPLFPAQRYMPATPLSVHGWNGFDWPAMDLLLQNLFDRRFGLFAFGPLLLLALAAPFVAPTGRGDAHVQRPERILIAGLFAALLLFTSANQFARLQWNTGFRMLAPLVPLLFLLVAEVLVRMPRTLAAGLGTAAVLHGASLAMVRADALASPATVLREGPRLPWLTSMARAGTAYLPEGLPAHALAPLLLAIAAAALAFIWTRAPADGAAPAQARRTADRPQAPVC